MELEDLIEQVVTGRYYTYRTDYGINVYEAYFEDGERVVKKLARFDHEAEADEVVAAFRTLFREFFNDHFKIQTYKGQTKKPTLGMVKKYIEAEKQKPSPF